MSSGPSSRPPGGCRAQLPGWTAACGPGKMARPPSRPADARRSAFIPRDVACGPRCRRLSGSSARPQAATSRQGVQGKTRGVPAPIGPLSVPPAAGDPSPRRNEPVRAASLRWRRTKTPADRGAATTTALGSGIFQASVWTSDRWPFTVSFVAWRFHQLSECLTARLIGRYGLFG
jgi:hypothetical protein